MGKHTPGPWSIIPSKDGSGDVGITAAGLPNVLGEVYCAIRSHDERAVAEADANARLIAAAPELLAALKAVEPFGDLQPANAMKAGLTGAERASFDEIIAKVRAALAKAGS